MSDIERSSSDDVERPPGAWVPVVVIGGLALIGALWLIKAALSLLFSTLGFVLMIGIVVGVIYVLGKGYRRGGA